MYQNHRQHNNRLSVNNRIIAEKPETWGKFLWLSMHAVASGYPLKPTEMDKDIYRLHFENMANVLPCCECRNHFHQILRSHPLHDQILKSRKSLSEWVLLLHNAVSKEIGKPASQCNWTYEMLVKTVDQTAGLDGTEPFSNNILQPQLRAQQQPEPHPDPEPIQIAGLVPPESQGAVPEMSNQKARMVSKGVRIKQMMEVQRANSQRTKYLQMQRTYGYVGIPNSSASRRELNRNPRRLGAAPNRTRPVQSGSVSPSTSASDKPKRKGCGCGGRKK